MKITLSPGHVSAVMAPYYQRKFAQAIADSYYRAKEYAKSITWTQRYFKEGGNDGQMRVLLAQSYYLSGDYANAAKELGIEIRAVEKAGGKPAEDRLTMLASRPCSRSSPDWKHLTEAKS